MVKTSFAIGIFLAVASALPAGAGQSVDVGVGSSKVIRFDRPAAQVVLGDPAVADVSMQSPRMLTVIGRKVGGTTLAVFDRQGEALVEAPVIVRAGDNDVVVLYMGGKDVVQGGRETVYTCGERCVRVTPPAAAGGAAAPVQ